MADFIPLRVSSSGSFLADAGSSLIGASSPEALLARAHKLGYNALALTDTDGLYLAFPFVTKARELGIHPILGARITLPAGAVGSPPCALTVLARTRRGYARLCELVTARRLDENEDSVHSLTRRSCPNTKVERQSGNIQTTKRTKKTCPSPSRGISSPPRRVSSPPRRIVNLRDLRGESARADPQTVFSREEYQNESSALLDHLEGVGADLFVLSESPDCCAASA